MRDLIRKEFGIDLAVRTVGEYLNRWGYTAKKPRRHARKQDPEEVRQWLEETYPAIEKRAEEEVRRSTGAMRPGRRPTSTPVTATRGKGKPAKIEVPDPHLRMNQISAISNRGEVRFMTYAKAMNAALFLVFLERLLRSTTGKVFLIVDRLAGPSDARGEGLGGGPP